MRILKELDRFIEAIGLPDNIPCTVAFCHVHVRTVFLATEWNKKNNLELYVCFNLYSTIKQLEIERI